MIEQRIIVNTGYWYPNHLVKYGDLERFCILYFGFLLL